MGWTSYDVANNNTMNSTRAHAGSAEFSKTHGNFGNTTKIIEHTDRKKRRISEITLMLWGIFDLVALGMMVWAVVASGLLSVETVSSTLEVGLFEHCTTPVGGEMTCIRTGFLSANPYWQAAGGILIATLMLSVTGIFVILLASCNGGGWVRSARLCAAVRNFCLFAGWVMVPVGFAGLGDDCKDGNEIHCNYGETAIQPDGSTAGAFGFFEIPSNWKSSIGTYGLFASVLMHYVGSGVAGWILLRKGEGLGRQGATAHNNSFQVSANGSYMSRMTPSGLQTSFDGPSAHVRRASTMSQQGNTSMFGGGGPGGRGVDHGSAYPTTTLSRTQIC